MEILCERPRGALLPAPLNGLPKGVFLLNVMIFQILIRIFLENVHKENKYNAHHHMFNPK